MTKPTTQPSIEGPALILALDKQQSIQRADAKFCARDKNHGRLLVLKSSMLGCTICGYAETAELLPTEVAPSLASTEPNKAPAVRVK